MSTTPSDYQYHPTTKAPPVVDQGHTAQPTGLDATVGPLPFTGFDVIAMTAVALAVTLVGLGLQRAVRR